MKLLGYNRVHGEKNGKSWDFVNLIIEKENVNPGPECGGSVLVTRYSQGRGISFPSIPTNDFTNLLRNGLRPGSDLRVYKDIDDTIHVELM